jgi:hypothetical protein
MKPIVVLGPRLIILGLAAGPAAPVPSTRRAIVERVLVAATQAVGHLVEEIRVALPHGALKDPLIPRQVVASEASALLERAWVVFEKRLHDALSIRARCGSNRSRSLRITIVVCRPHQGHVPKRARRIEHSRLIALSNVSAVSWHHIPSTMRVFL